MLDEQNQIIELAKSRLPAKSFHNFEILHSGGAIKPTPSQDDQAYICYLAMILDCDYDAVIEHALASERADVPHKGHKQGKHKWHYNKTYLSRSVRKACNLVADTRSKRDSHHFKSWQDVTRAMKSRKNPPTEAHKRAAIAFIVNRYLPHKQIEKAAQIGLQDDLNNFNDDVTRDELLKELSLKTGFWNDYHIKRLLKNELVSNKYLPDIDMTGFNTLLIQSDLGTGKTELAHRMIQAQGDNKSVLVITPRRSLTISAAKRLGIGNYEDIKKLPTESKEQRAEKAKQAQCMACTVNSVQDLVSDDHQYDLIIIDESELLALHLTGNAFDNKEKGLQHFYKLLKNARVVTFLDAFLSRNTAFLAAQSGREKSLTKVVINPFNIWGNVSIKWFEGDKDGQALAIEKLFSEIGNSTPVFSFSNSNDKINAIYAKAVQQFPNKRFLLINRQTVGDDAQMAFLAEPSQECELYDGIFCSPTVETGLSIDSPRFKHVYGFFENTDSTGTATGAIQQLARCRAASEWNVYCRDMPNDEPTDETEIFERIKSNVQNAIKECSAVESGLLSVNYEITPTLVTMLYCRVKSWENTQKNNFYKSLHTLLTGFMGCSVEHQGGFSVVGEELLAHGKAIADNQYAQDFAATADIDKADYEQFTSDRKSKLFADNRLACERYELREFYRVDIIGFEVFHNGEYVCTLSELLELDGKGKGIRKQITALETATAHTNDVLRYGAANLLGNDFLNMTAREQSARIHSLPTQHRVRKLALEAIGVKDLAQVDWDNPPKFTATDIVNSEFARYITANLAAVNAAPIGIKFPSNWLGNPCLYMRHLLNAIGLVAHLESQPHSARAPEKVEQVNTNLSIKDNSANLFHGKSANTMKNKNKTTKIRIYSLGKTQAFCFFLRRKESGVNWVADRLRKLKEWEQAGNSVKHAQLVVDKLQSLVSVLTTSDEFTQNDTLTDCVNILSARATTDGDTQKMFDDVLSTLCNIEQNARTNATKPMLIDCCNAYIDSIKPVPLIQENDLKLIKKLTKSPKGLQLGTVVGRVFGRVDAETIDNALSTVKHLVKIGACSLEKHAQDKLKSMVKLVDTSPIYSHFCGVVL